MAWASSTRAWGRKFSSPQEGLQGAPDAKAWECRWHTPRSPNGVGLPEADLTWCLQNGRPVETAGSSSLAGSQGRLCSQSQPVLLAATQPNRDARACSQVAEQETEQSSLPPRRPWAGRLQIKIGSCTVEHRRAVGKSVDWSFHRELTGRRPPHVPKAPGTCADSAGRAPGPIQPQPAQCQPGWLTPQFLGNSRTKASTFL